MDLSGYEVSRVLTCRSRQIKLVGDGNENLPLYYHIADNIQIQFGREEFCLVTGLRFGVENWVDYANDNELIPFRRRVFPSYLDGQHITGTMLVLLGVEGKRRVPDWMLWLANDRVGNTPATRLTPDEIEARSDWWISSRAYFDGGIGQAERVPRHLNRKNMYEVPLDFYREFKEQKRVLEQQKRDIKEIRKNKADRQQMYEKVRKFIEGMNVEPVRQVNKGPINVSQHYGISDLSEFPSMQVHLIGKARCRPQSATPYWQPAIPSHPGIYNWQSQMSSHMGNPKLQSPIEMHHDAAGLFDQNILNRGKREQRPSIYKRTLYMEQPPTTVLPKQRGNKTKNNVKKDNLSPLNLGNAFDDDNEGGADVMFLGAQFTGNYLVYENVDVSKVGCPEMCEYTRECGYD
ncbi:hypothetical protein Tco_0231406 [Tanacetum coccineum]